jgi:hypothetical protein
MAFTNTAELETALFYDDVSLFYPFSFTGDAPLPKDRYKTLTGSISFKSDERKALSMDASAKMGGFYNGRLT